jgi:uncharacterized protein (TIGR02646 family)
MRQIKKGTQPRSLTEWRNSFKATGVSPGYSSMPSEVRDAVRQSLLQEQGGLCAYTGRRITDSSAHIEHLKPQAHCITGAEDIDYSNLVACYPAPNSGACPYGAHAKGSWPNPTEAADFVSPLFVGCEQRFLYRYSGKVDEKPGDIPAKTTRDRLNLNDPELIDMRKAAIKNTLAPQNRQLTKPQVQTRLQQLKAQTYPLDELHFVLVQQLQRHLEKTS